MRGRRKANGHATICGCPACKGLRQPKPWAMIPTPKNALAQHYLELWFMCHVKARLWVMRGLPVRYAYRTATYWAKAFDQANAKG